MRVGCGGGNGDIVFDDGGEAGRFGDGGGHGKGTWKVERWKRGIGFEERGEEFVVDWRRIMTEMSIRCCFVDEEEVL